MTSTPVAAGIRAVLVALTTAALGVLSFSFMFTLPAFGSLRPHGTELGILLMPAAAAVVFVLCAMLMAALPVVARGAWLVATIGALVSFVGLAAMELNASDDMIFSTMALVVSAGFGAIYAGLFRYAAGAGPAERATLAFSLVTGFILHHDVLRQFMDSVLLPFGVFTVMVLLCALLSLRLPPGTPAEPDGAALVAVPAAAAIVVAGMIARARLTGSSRPDPQAIPALPAELMTRATTLIAVASAVVAVLLLAWLGHRQGGAGLTGWVVLGLGLAPMTSVPGFVATQLFANRFAALTMLLAAGAGVLLATLAGRIFAWEVLGLLAAAAGQFLLPISFTTPGVSAEPTALLLTCGFGFALGAGLTRALSLPSAVSGAGLGLIALFIAAQALAPVAFEAAASSDRGGLAQLTTTIIPVAAAAFVVVLFTMHRRARSGRDAGS